MEYRWRQQSTTTDAKLFSPSNISASSNTELLAQPLVKEYNRRSGENKPNEDYIEFINIHRQKYNPVANWYNWEKVRTGRNKLSKQNDIDYHKHVRKIHGLHEQHLAEELHRHQTFSTQYTNQKRKTLSIDPSIPPMGDLKFDSSDPEQFSAMWLHWSECFPAHAYDINRELYQSTKEKRIPWWDLKHISRTTLDPNNIHTGVTRHTPHSTRKTGYRILTDPDRNSFELTFLSSPCRICGSRSHPALRGEEDEYGEATYKYICHCAAYDDWERESMRACPHKLAEESDFSPQKVEIAIKEMCEHGWGKFLSKRNLKIFEALALQHCETDSEDDNIDEEYDHIQANIALSTANQTPDREDYHTPEASPRSPVDRQGVPSNTEA